MSGPSRRRFLDGRPEEGRAGGAAGGSASDGCWPSDAGGGGGGSGESITPLGDGDRELKSEDEERARRRLERSGGVGRAR